MGRFSTYFATTLMLLIMIMPTTLAHARPRVDIDVDAEATLEVVAHATSRTRLSFEWDWGDGSTSVGATARHEYAEPGEYEVVLHVTDEDDDECWTERRTVTVEMARERGRDDDEPRESRRDRSADAQIGAGPIDARASVRWGGHHDAEDPSEESASAHASASSRGDRRDRHESPGVEVPLLLSGLGALALGWRRRRGSG